MVRVLAAMADFERDLIIERTQAGQARARAEGKHMGRPPKTTESQRVAIRNALDKGATVTSMAERYKVSRATIISVRAAKPN
jgi:putative DNA-invertase from lambdoid prophage Rac